MRAALLAAALAATGCLEGHAVVCESGRVCPSGAACDEVHGACVLPEQLTACDGDDDGTACQIAGQAVGICDQDVCVRAGCGDGYLGELEQCDGDQLGEARDCLDLDYYQPGALACNDDCTYDVSGCTGSCGDGVADLDRGEQCDGDDLAGVSDCTELEFYRPGPVACTALCRYDTAGCAEECGDGERNGPELCDGTPPDLTCIEIGYDAGFLDCLPLGCTPDFLGCHELGWRTVQTPVASDFWAVGGALPTELFAVGDGVVLRYDGVDWKVDHQPAYSATMLFVTGPGDAWVAGEGAITHYSDGSWFPSWSNAGELTFDYTHALYATGPNDAYYFSGAIEGSLRFDGDAWTVDPDVPIFDGGVQGAAGAGAGDVWVLEVDALHHRASGSWSELALPIGEGLSLWHDGADVWVGGLDGGAPAVARGDGDSWEVWPLPATGDATGVLDLWGSSADDVYAVSFQTMYHFDGAAWSVVGHSAPSLHGVGGTGPGEPVWAVGDGVIDRFRGSALVDDAAVVQAYSTMAAAWGTGPGELWVTRLLQTNPVEQSVVLHFDGETWTEEYAAPDEYLLHDVWGSGAGDVWAVGEYGTVLHRDGGGWGVETDLGSTLNGVWGVAPGDVFVAGFAGVWRSGAWLPEDLPVNVYGLRGIWGRGADDLYAVGDEGVIVHRGAGGWTQMDSGTTARLRAVWGAATGPVFAVGDDGVILALEGGEWTRMDSGTPVTLHDVHGLAGDDVFAVGDGGTILHFDGARWSPVVSPTIEPLRGAFSVGDTTLLVGGLEGAGTQGVAIRLVRTRPW